MFASAAAGALRGVAQPPAAAARGERGRESAGDAGPFSANASTDASETTRGRRGPSHSKSPRRRDGSSAPVRSRSGRRGRGSRRLRGRGGHAGSRRGRFPWARPSRVGDDGGVTGGGAFSSIVGFFEAALFFFEWWCGASVAGVRARFWRRGGGAAAWRSRRGAGGCKEALRSSQVLLLQLTALISDAIRRFNGPLTEGKS